MGLLDTVLGGLMGGSQNASPLQSILGSLLSGGQAAQPGQQPQAGQGGLGGLAGTLAGGLSGGMGGGLGGALAGMGGLAGLGGLLSQFQQAGLGHIAESWMGSGPNQPVSPDQLQQVLGHERVNDLAQQANMAPHDMLSQLSQLLPHAVDQLTPGGETPGESPFDKAGQGL